MKRNGYTLTELLIATAIGGVLIVIISIIAIIGFTQMSSLRDRLAAEESLDKVELYFRSTLGQAVDVAAADLAIGAFPFAVPGWTGNLSGNFQWDQIADTPAAWNAIGYFYREIGGSGAQAVQSVGGTLRPTAIFYRRPESTGTAGVLFFDNGETTTLTPDYSDLFVDRITYLAMDKNINTTYVPNKVSSVRIRVSVRYHDFGIPLRTWCPTLDITNGVAGCDNGSKFRDLDREFTVLIRNNLLKTAGTASITGSLSEERIMDSLYFFRMITAVTE